MTKLQTWTITVLGTVTLLVGILLATGAITSAQTPTPTPAATEEATDDGATPTPAPSQDNADSERGCHGGKGLVKEAAAEVLGLSEDELRAQLQSGQTLADIAQAQGMSVDDFKGALTDKVTANLQASLDAGEITQEQFDDITAELDEKLDDIINAEGGLRFHGGFHHRFDDETDETASTDA